MAVASRGSAISALRALITHDPVPASTLLRRPYLPDGMVPSSDPTRMSPDTLVGGYGDASRYVLPGRSAQQSLDIAAAPAEVLQRPGISADDALSYVKSSMDLTMQGGTTSGVVYPLAVCELATGFRFRNVGGASAGAIAAALTAAAELGRSEKVRRPERAVPEANPAIAPGDSSPGRPSIRRGFVGLTDVLSWLTQTRADDSEADQFRLAQLFRPSAGTHNLFRVLIAMMRRRSWSLPVILLMAFGWLTRAIAVSLIFATVALAGWVGDRFSGLLRPWYEGFGWGLLHSAACVAGLIGLVQVVSALRTILAAKDRGPRPPPWLMRLRSVSSSHATPQVATLRQLLIGVVLLLVAGAVAWWRPRPFAAALLVVLAGALIVLLVLLRSVFVFIGTFNQRSYGLIPGTTPRRRGNLLDRLAGAPKATVEESVVPWLYSCLNQLSGLPPEAVLRFGHLWSGADFHETRIGATAERQAQWRQMSARTDFRLVNLELMTTDLTRQRPFRFPLPATELDDPAQLWLAVDELEHGDSAVFPATVLAALREGASRQVADDNGVVRTLHPLPPPWDLPVIFAVRLSMALPALFQAIPMYRLVQAVPIQDDFGRTIHNTDGAPLLTVSASASASWVAEQLWFSDGGITSNFPVHFFDSPLPRWPTVSLNLGPHPDSSPHQDVWLPQDWDVTTIPVEPLKPSGLSLAGAVLNTAMSWRDSMQSAMPGYRNRIAQVRTRPNEGGTNLFMSREVIASMALRGALAGARLRTRFADESHWNRFRWMRLRVAMSNLERLRRSTAERRGFYADAFSGPSWLADQQAGFSDKPADFTVPWYEPVGQFWPKAPRLLNTYADAYRPPPEPLPNEMTTNVPSPEPALRQVAQE